MIVQKDEFTRATIKAGATADQLIRALQDIPGDAIINDFEIDYDYQGNEPFPLSVKLAVEWVTQSPEADTQVEGGAS